jgi:hypothetical protein
MASILDWLFPAKKALDSAASTGGPPAAPAPTSPQPQVIDMAAEAAKMAPKSAAPKPTPAPKPNAAQKLGSQLANTPPND